MGAQISAKLNHKASADNSTGGVNFDDFHVLRVIGKGSFGKVCIVQKRDTGRMYAMKYMNKSQCLEKKAIKNVVREMSILRHLEHPFLVNLWFSFQDEEDWFMVVDVLLGGDLRYHLQQNVFFGEESIRLFLCEIASALDYLKSQHILHRDVKPENVILDEDGHAHLTDFNIATVLKDGEMAVSVSGTKPYMAPEVYRCAIDSEACYDYKVDWWSLGVCIFELSTGLRPYDIHSFTSAEDCLRLFEMPLVFPKPVNHRIRDAIYELMQVNARRRPSSLEEIKSLKIIKDSNWSAILRKELKPLFVPPRDHLNCDPSLELEEMIMESKPLHKKKKRLMKQRSQPDFFLNSVTSSVGVLNFESCQQLSQHAETLEEFVPYNRESWLAEEERRLKEEKWEKELLEAMEASSHSPTPTSNQETRQDLLSRSRSMREQSISSIFKEPPQAASHSLVSTPLCPRHKLISE